MSVTRIGDRVQLTGRCGVEEAEVLLAHLLAGCRQVDLTGCEHLHAALVQLLMAADVELSEPPAGFLGSWIVPAAGLQQAGDRGNSPP